MVDKYISLTPTNPTLPLSSGNTRYPPHPANPSCSTLSAAPFSSIIPLLSQS